MFRETQSKRLQKLQSRVAGIILDVSNDVNHTTALCTLGSKPLSTERKTARAKVMFKILNKMGPRSVTDLFPYKSEKTEYQARDIPRFPKPRTDHMKKALCMTEQNFGILFLKTSGKVNHFLPFAKKSPLT